MDRAGIFEEFLESRVSADTLSVADDDRNIAAARSPADHSLWREITSVLRKASYPAIRRIRCQVQNGAVTLRGRVPSFYQKQMAQTLVMKQVASVRVVNQLEVASTE